MIVTEYNGHTQGFLVAAVENILRLEWTAMKVPPQMLTEHMGNLVTAVSELDDGRLVMMIDVERILAETSGFSDEIAFKDIQPLPRADRTVVYADDSSVARKQIDRTLEAMHVRGHGTINGRLAWQELQRIADTANLSGKPVRDYVQVVLTDVEMPEMDGYMLTKMVKSDPRFAGIPVVMHSSLSGNSNQSLGRSVGVDEYVTKFQPGRLAETLPDAVSACLVDVQHDLFDLGGELSIPGYEAVSEAHVARLEERVEHFNGPLEPLKEFVLPGGTRAAALAHVARTVCRRAERALVHLGHAESVSVPARRYVNRLSDLLFVIARALNVAAGRPDVLWKKGRVRGAGTE